MLNSEQEVAVAMMVEHCKIADNFHEPMMVLEGPAGTGKTYCMTELVNRVKRRIVFTAPTNKAVKVLRESIKSDDYKPECRTIFSLLGLQLQVNGEVKELGVKEEKLDLSEYGVVVVDEGSMIGKILNLHMKKASKAYPNLRWIIMGDRWQLPPVGEGMSEIWELPKRVELTRIMRQDNQILKLSAQVRGQILTPFAPLTLESDNDKLEGVWALGAANFNVQMRERAQDFLEGKAKAIAWTNARVDMYNAAIREELFADTARFPWQVGDRATLLEPCKNLEDEIVGTTDEEGTVERAGVDRHPLHPEFKVWNVDLRTDFNRLITLRVLHSEGKLAYERKVARLAAEARVNRQLWKAFWGFKESFHSIRHAYAQTAHRAQGSTYEIAYVNWRDILRNSARSEAYRCLYVGVTRPKKELYLG